jgi:16S rRNA G966 N2-methylase RsmD
MTAPPRRVLPNAVRIIGGQWKRTRLPVADKPGLRPTPDRVRETLFNWLGQDLAGWRCLDAFAGTGALGFEAASRGAAEVVLLERDRGLARGLEQMRVRLSAPRSGPALPAPRASSTKVAEPQLLEATAAVHVHNVDALRWMEGSAPAAFDLVFLDPPFDAGLVAPALALAPRLLAGGGQVYIEGGAPPDAEALVQLGWQVRRASRAGQVHFALLVRG